MSLSINVLLLIELIAIVIAASAFLFYINRLGGSIVSFLIRLYTWRRHHAYITIGSLQISPLAGRISFRDIEYHSSNISVRALHGNVTWRYWKFRVRQGEDAGSSHVKRNALPSRVFVNAQGVEAFFYNRTPAYDNIVERMKKYDAAASSSSPKDLSKPHSGTSESSGGREKSGLRERISIRRDKSKVSSEGVSQDAKRPGGSSSVRSTPDSSDVPMVDWAREIMPMDFSIQEGSLILGNDATPSVLIAHFARSTGGVNYTDSKSPCDHRKLLVDFGFHNLRVLTRTNVDYSGPLLSHGKKAYDELLRERPETAHEPTSSISSFWGFHAIARKFRFLSNPKFSTPPVAGLPRDRMWRGLARYRLPEDGPRVHSREEREYAKAATLLETRLLECTYYHDVPGLVPTRATAAFIDETDQVGNVEPPPEYGVDVTVHGGLINYGPWADRQRDALQTAFAPPILFHSEPKEWLNPGDTRIYTNMVVNVLLAAETTLRIPTREPSKDWRFDSAPADAERPYGWLDVTVGPDSSVVYTQAQEPTAHGYDSMLALHLDRLTIASSINFEPFIKAASCKLSITMPVPLEWNAQRDWGFDITLEEPKVTLMRDHTTLISDLARDWSSGQQGDYQHFVPNHYNFRVTILNYAFHLFINDYNIIDKPSSREDNAMLDIYGPRLDTYIAVSATQYRPEFSVVPFSLEARDLIVEIGVPRWDTHRGVNGEQSYEIGKIGELSVGGSYRYYAEPKPDHQESLTLHVEGRRVAFKALGWVLRRLFCVKDNYFGGFTQFTTMQEFQSTFDHDPKAVGDPVEKKYRPGRSDPYAVQVTMNVEDSLVIMSDEIYGCEQGIVIPVPQLQMSLRSQEHFMDLSLDSPPTHILPAENLSALYQSMALPDVMDEVVYLEGIELKANRLFGPQPRAETYLCLWEALIPRLTCFTTPRFTSSLQAVIAAVGYNFSDVDNAPAGLYHVPGLPDVTFFKLSLGEASISLSKGNSIITCDLTSGANFDLSTWATRFCSSSIGALVPTVSVRLLRRDSEAHKWTSTVEITTGATVDVFAAGKGWRNAVADQQAFLRKQDADTRRIAYLYDPSQLAPTNGQFFYDVHVPTPRPPSDIEEPVDSASSDFDSEDELEVSTSSASSNSSSSDTAKRFRGRAVPSRKPTYRRSRPVSFTGSLSEEGSVSASTHSSISSYGRSNADPNHDPLDHMAAKIRQLRSMKQPLIDFETLPEPSDGESSTSILAATHRGGTIMNISILPVTVALDPSAALPIAELMAAGLMTGFRDLDVRPELVLDRLLIAHTDRIGAAEDNQLPTSIKITVPAVKARIHPGPTLLADPVIEVQLSGFAGQRSLWSLDGETYVDANGTLDHLRVFLCSKSPDIQLNTSLSDSLPGDLIAQFLSDNLSVNLDTRARRQCLVFLCAQLSASIVTPATEQIKSLVQLWRTASDDLPKTANIPHPASFLIHNAVTAAVEQNQTLRQPSFAHESSYGLQHEDQRNIRRDLGWSILTRARHWMRTLGPAKDTAPDNIADSTVKALLAVEEFALDNDMFIRQLPCIRIAFGDGIYHQNDANAPELDRDIQVFVKVDILRLVHEGKLHAKSPVEKSVVSLFSISTGTRYRTYFRDGQCSDQLRSVNTVKDIHVELRDSMLPALGAILDLGSGTPPNEAVSTAPKATRRQLSVTVDNHVGQCNVHLVGGDLRLSLSLADSYGNVMSRTGSTDPDVDASHCADHTALVGLQDLTMTVLAEGQSQHLLSLPADRTIACTTVNHLKVVLKNCRSLEKDAEVLKQLAISLGDFGFDIHPQIKSLGASLVNWKKEHWPHYAPSFHRYTSMMVSPAGKAAYATESVVVNKVVDVQIKSIALSVRAAQSLKVKWDVKSLFVSVNGPPHSRSFGIRVSPQTVGAYSLHQDSETGSASRLQLPSIRINGTQCLEGDEESRVADVQLGVFKGDIKPATLDRLLHLYSQLYKVYTGLRHQHGPSFSKAIKSARSKSGSFRMSRASSSPASGSHSALPRPSGFLAPSSKDLPETVIEDDMPDTPPGSGVELPASAPGPLIVWDVRISVRRVLLGFHADDVASTIWLQGSGLEGQVSSGTDSSRIISWGARVSHLEVSLGYKRADIGARGAGPSADQKSASMSLDATVRETPATADRLCRLNIELRRVHSVMHIVALKETSELVRSWSRDIRSLHDARAAEVADVKERTSKFIKRFEARETDSTISKWLSKRVLVITMSGIGIAVPLDADATIDMWDRKNKAGSALLFTIHRMTFENQRNQAATFRLLEMKLQFVDNFDSGKVEHYSGITHSSQNRMDVKVIDSEAQMSTTAESWTVAAHSSAKNFRLDLSPSISDGVFRLIALYRQGKKHVATIGQEYKTGLAKFGQDESVVVKYLEQSSIPAKLVEQKIRVRMSFDFESGLVELAHVPFTPPFGKAEPRADEREGLTFVGRDAATKPTQIKLPGISAWVDYDGATVGVEDNNEGGALIINTAIHESTNTLDPSISPFVVGLINSIRANRSAEGNDTESAELVDEPPNEDVNTQPIQETTDAAHGSGNVLKAIANAPTGLIRLIATLRIDQSTLTFKSESDTSILDLTWSSGGVVCSTTFGAERVTTIAGTVTGVALNLRGRYERDKSCLTAAAEDLAFNAIYFPAHASEQQGWSVVLDTSISSQFRLGFLYAFLAMNAEWIDNAPQLAKSEIEPAEASAEVDRPISKTPLAIAIAVRIRRIEFDAEVSISRAKLKISPLIIKAVSDGENQKIEVRLGQTEVKADGQISCVLTSERLGVHAARRSSRARGHHSASVLNLSIDGGDLAGHLSIGTKSVAQFKLAPTTVTLYDDWTRHNEVDGDGSVELRFDVKAGKFLALVPLEDIPNLLAYISKVSKQIERQKDRAMESSSVYRRMKDIKQDQPSKLGTALHNARRASLTATTSGTLKTVEIMNLSLAGIDFGAFASARNSRGVVIDDLYRYKIGAANATYKSWIDDKEDDHRRRDLNILVDVVYWYNIPGLVARQLQSETQGVEEYISRLNGHKAMSLRLELRTAKLSMHSTQISDDPRDILKHDCSLDFVENLSDVAFMPNYWQEASNVFDQLVFSLNEQQQLKSKPRPSAKVGDASVNIDKNQAKDKPKDDRDKPGSATDNNSVIFVREGGSVKVPELRVLGDGTMNQLVRMMPDLQNNMNDKTPVILHRFVTVPLEDQMKLLLKLYTKFLPNTKRPGASVDTPQTEDTQQASRPSGVSVQEA